MVKWLRKGSLVGSAWLATALSLGACGYDFDGAFAQTGADGSGGAIGGAGGADSGVDAGAGGAGGASGTSGSGATAGTGGSTAAGGTGTGGTGIGGTGTGGTGTGGISGAAGASGTGGSATGGGGLGGTSGSGGSAGTGGSGGASGAGGSGGNGGSPPCGVYDSSACDQCVGDFCAAECNDALAEPGLDAFMACRDDCAWSGSCRNGCRQDYPDLLDEVSALEDCKYTNCGHECGGFSCTSYTGGDQPACDACMVDSCMNACDSCQDNPDCPPYWTCFVWCSEPGEPSCSTCTSQFSGGSDEMAALFSTTGCLYLNCGSECY